MRGVKANFLFLAFLAVTFVSAAALPGIAKADVAFPPSTSTFKEKVALLNYIREMIPGLFEQGAEYDVNPLLLLDSQAELVTRLLQSQDYMTLSAEKPNLHRIVIEMIQHEVQASKPQDQAQVYSLDVAREWYGFAKKKISNLAKTKASGATLQKEKLLEEVRSEIRKNISELIKRDPVAMLTGFIQCLPASERGAIFRLPQKEQVAALRSNPAFTQEALARGFRYDAYDADLRNLSRDELLNAVESSLALEVETARWIYLERALSLYPVDSATSKDLISYAKKITAKEPGLTLFRSPEQLIEALGGSDSKPFSAIMKRIASSHLMRFKAGADAKEPSVRVVDRIILQEVSPYLGIFRGFVGGDCSTQYSYPYVYAPGERTYFIYDSHGEVKGYVMATIVEITGKQGVRALYLHDVVGPRVSEKMAEMIVYGLHQVRQKLGAQLFVLPFPARTEANNNYGHLQKKLNSMLTPGEVYFTYVDAQVRSLLGTAMHYKIHTEYDTPRGNPFGYKPKLEASLAEALRVTFEPTPHRHPSLQEMDRPQSLLLALSLDYYRKSALALKALEIDIASGVQPQAIETSHRAQAVEQLLSEAGIAQDEYDQLQEVLANRTKMKLVTYYKAVANALKAFGITVNDEFLRTHRYLFYDGHLNAADAFDESHPKQLKRTIHDVVDLLKRWPDLPELREKVAHAPELFATDVRFKNYLASLLTPDQANVARLMAYRAMGIDLSVLSGELEKLEAMKRSQNLKAKKLADEILSSGANQCFTHLG